MTSNITYLLLPTHPHKSCLSSGRIILLSGLSNLFPGTIMPICPTAEGMLSEDVRGMERLHGLICTIPSPTIPYRLTRANDLADAQGFSHTFAWLLQLSVSRAQAVCVTMPLQGAALAQAAYALLSLLGSRTKVYLYGFPMFINCSMLFNAF